MSTDFENPVCEETLQRVAERMRARNFDVVVVADRSQGGCRPKSAPLA